MPPGSKCGDKKSKNIAAINIFTNKLLFVQVFTSFCRIRNHSVRKGDPVTYEELFLEIEHLRSQMIALASRGADHDQVLEVSRRLDELYSALP